MEVALIITGLLAAGLAIALKLSQRKSRRLEEALSNAIIAQLRVETGALAEEAERARKKRQEILDEYRRNYGNPSDSGTRGS